MRSLRLVALVGILIFSRFKVFSQEQANAELTVTVSAQKVLAKEFLTMEIVLRNVSQLPLYIQGSIRPGLLAPYGNYELQVRPVGSNEWARVGGVSSDPYHPFHQADGRPLSADEFKVQNNIFLLEPKRFIGYRESGTWTGLTVKSVGKWELRIVYSALELPVRLEKPFLTGTVASNIVRVEVVP